MIRISPFTPLFFSPSSDTCGTESRYIQTFAPSDQIFVELICDKSDETPTMHITDHITGTVGSISGIRWEINGESSIILYRIQNLLEGKYTVEIAGSESEPFGISEQTEDTVLIQYSMKDNRQRGDCAFWIDGMQYFFDFRVKGGFKDNGWIFAVESNQFMTSEMDPVTIYSHESLAKNLTIGGAEGCPIWIAEHLNRLLCCNYVYIDGVRYARKETSVPEVNVLIEDMKSYVFVQQVQQVANINPRLEQQNQAIIRRTLSKYRTANNNPLIVK